MCKEYINIYKCINIYKYRYTNIYMFVYIHICIVTSINFKVLMVRVIASLSKSSGNKLQLITCGAGTSSHGVGVEVS